MIKASELRIGNWVLLEVHPDLPRPHKVMPKDIFDIAAGRVTLSAIEGIKLTPEILEKAGFENTYSSKQKQSYDDLINGEFGVNFHSIGSVYDKEGRTFVRYFSENIRKPVKYLHELQNLYFALTGEELTINL